MKRAVIAVALLAASFPLIAQETGKGVLGQVGALGQEVKRAPVQTGPAPRLPDGTIDLNGLWIGGGPIFNIATQGGIKPEDVPMLPAARTLMQSRKEEEDPHYFCMPMGVPRATPYPFRFVQNYTHKKPTHIFKLEEGNIHSYRQIFMDGRKHPPELDPTWFGHSIGRFDGKDTLVIDTVGFNDKFWFDRKGTPHTEQLHTIERFTRIDPNILDYQITIDDPKMFTRPIKIAGTFQAATAGTELMEFACAEGSQVLPNVFGFELARRLKEDHRTRHIPLIAVTGRRWAARSMGR